MRNLRGLMLLGTLLAGTSSVANAQVAVSIGNPYTGQGVFVGAPAYGYGYSPAFSPAYGSSGLNNYYSSGYLGAPRPYGYSSGYAGFAAPVVGVSPYPYGYSPYYRSYGYGGYGYRNYGGFQPFRGVARRFR